MIFQSTCSVRSKTATVYRFWHADAISIHLLRAEQDLPHVGLRVVCVKFQSTCSVRSKTFTSGRFSGLLRFQSTCSVRSKTFFVPSIQSKFAFQSTCSVRSKTIRNRRRKRVQQNFNPLAPCGARQQTVIKTVCKGRSYCTDHLLISPTKGTSSRKKNHSDGRNSIHWVRTHPGFGVN